MHPCAGQPCESMNAMKRLLIAIVLLIAAPASGQIVTPIISPPCIAKHCPGATQTQTPGTQSHACPPGTVYMPQKGTCRVLPAAPGN
jgi:hypothetical protein